MINDLKIKFNQDFLNFIEDEEQKELSLVRKRTQYLKLVPTSLLSHVEWAIDKKFKGDVDKWAESVPLFFKLFKLDDFKVANFAIALNDNNRIQMNRARKRKLLWAAQLLKLVGKNAHKYMPISLINEYVEQQRKQEEYCEKALLINSSGKTFKLTPPSVRKKHRSAENYRISKLHEKIAKDRDFTWAFITLTLPPAYHPNPTKGKNRYSGVTPEVSANALQDVWAKIRSNLNKHGMKAHTDYFGTSVQEAHKDSCLHLHALIHLSHDNLPVLKSIIKKQEEIQRHKLAKEYNMPFNQVRLNYDFKEAKPGKASASTYLFKYINPDTNDKATIANEACRSYYGIRAVRHFGVKNKLTTFNHLCKNYKNYENVFENDEIVKMLKDRDLYLFHTKYQDDFENVNVDFGTKRKFIGVSYVPDRKNAFQRLTSQEILIKKNQCIIVEDFTFQNARDSYEYIYKKQNSYNRLIVEYFEKQFKSGFDNFVIEMKSFVSDTSIQEIANHFNDRLKLDKIYFDTYFGKNVVEEIKLMNEENEMVTLKHPYSRETGKPFPVDDVSRHQICDVS